VEQLEQKGDLTVDTDGKDVSGWVPEEVMTHDAQGQKKQRGRGSRRIQQTSPFKARRVERCIVHLCVVRECLSVLCEEGQSNGQPVCLFEGWGMSETRVQNVPRPNRSSIRTSRTGM
jgi:hypothetical protein